MNKNGFKGTTELDFAKFAETRRKKMMKSVYNHCFLMLLEQNSF